MSFVANLVSVGVRWAFYLAAIGGLVDATLFMIQEASHVQQRGLVSLGKLNRALIGQRAEGYAANAKH
jgi:hypothetical protein